MAVLRSKHPHTSVDTRIVPLTDQGSPLCTTTVSVIAAIKSFAGSSSGGADRLHPGHIQYLVSMDANESGYRLLNSISRLVNHILNVNISYWSRDALFVFSLTALCSKDGGIRPIAVGNVFRRITNKLAVQSLCTSLGAAPPSKDGFVVAGGAEAAVHVTRKFINNARPHDIMLMIDMQIKFIHCAYSTLSALLISDKIIAFSLGVQQCDLLGPLLFSLTVNDIANSVGTPLSIWYLDDVTIGSPSESVIDSYPKLVSDVRSIGLKANTS